MSASQLSYVRKRRSDDESSDLESEEECPRVKRPRKWNRDTSMVPMFVFHIANFIATTCEDLMKWMNDIPFGRIFNNNMLGKTYMHKMEEDDPDVIEIPTDEDQDPEVVQELIEESAKDDADMSLAFSSAATYYEEVRLRSLESYLPQKPSNGYANGNRKCEQYRHRKTRSHRIGCADRQTAPLTNPGTEIEILLDTRECQIDPRGTPTYDSEDLEIVSEVKKRPNKRSPRSASSMYRNSQNSNTPSMSSFDAFSNGRTSTPYRREKSTGKYTALEVVRLQEKDQYRLLLEKMMNKSFHQPRSRKVSQPIEIQVDSDDDEPVITEPFKKEVLQQPVDDFLKKYYKPHKPAPPVAPLSPSVMEKFHEIGQGVDDDVQVVKEIIPEYKPKTKTMPDFFSNEWINELKTAINTETQSRIQIVKEQEEKLERFKKRRDAKNAEEKIIRDHLKLSGIVVDSIEENEFPELTLEMESEVDIALDQRRNPGELVSELPEKKVQVRRIDLQTLIGLNWLNDEIINFYLALIVERSEKNSNYPKVYTYNSFFYSSLKTRGPNKVLRWTKNVDIFAYDILIVPLHLGVHWALCAIDNRSKRIVYYDSMRSSEESCVRLLQTYVVVEMKDKKNIVIDPNSYSLEVAKDIPQQMNGSDCGMFALKYAEYISRDAPITFQQSNMPYFRRKMVYEIIHKQLL